LSLPGWYDQTLGSLLRSFPVGSAGRVGGWNEQSHSRTGRFRWIAITRPGTAHRGPIALILLISFESGLSRCQLRSTAYDWCIPPSPPACTDEQLATSACTRCPSVWATPWSWCLVCGCSIRRPQRPGSALRRRDVHNAPIYYPQPARFARCEVQGSRCHCLHRSLRQSALMIGDGPAAERGLRKCVFFGFTAIPAPRFHQSPVRSASSSTACGSVFSVDREITPASGQIGSPCAARRSGALELVRKPCSGR